MNLNTNVPIGKSRGKLADPPLRTVGVPYNNLRTPRTLSDTSNHQQPNELRATFSELGLSDADQKILHKYFLKSPANNAVLLAGASLQICVPDNMLSWYIPRLKHYLESGKEIILDLRDSSYKFTEHEVFQLVKILFPCPLEQQINFSNYECLLKFAVELNITSLLGKCKIYLQSIISEANWSDILNLAIKLHLKSLVAFVARYVANLDFPIIQSMYSILNCKVIALVLDTKLTFDAMGECDDENVLLLEDTVCKTCRRVVPFKFRPIGSAAVDSSQNPPIIECECATKYSGVNDKLLNRLFSK